MSTKFIPQQESKPESDTLERSIRLGLRERILGFRNTQLIAIAAKLDLANHLRHGWKSAEELAANVKADPAALYRLIRALTSIGIFQETPDRKFSNTKSSELLLDDAEGSLRNIAILYGEPWLWHAYGNMLHSVKSGEQAFKDVHGEGMYDYFQSHKEASSVFNAAMSAFSEIEADAIIKAYDFSAKKIVVDIGGGEGYLVEALIKSYPNLSGIVFDLTIPQQVGNGKDIRNRITHMAGDFFVKVPDGGDVYIMKSVLHNWDDDSCRAILKNCGMAMAEGSHLLVIERVIDETPGGSDAKLFDINMLVMVGGKERTSSEYADLFEESGFTLTRTIATASPLTILEATPNEN
jgi:hypothetical protein